MLFRSSGGVQAAKGPASDAGASKPALDSGDIERTPAAGLPALIARRWLEMARTDPDAEVRAHLATALRRFSPGISLLIVAELLSREEDVGDPFIPLLCWWVLEQEYWNDPAAVLRLFDDRGFWGRLLVREHILNRMARRLALGGRRADRKSTRLNSSH